MCTLASKSVLKDFTDDALTTSTGSGAATAGIASQYKFSAPLKNYYALGFLKYPDIKSVGRTFRKRF